MPISHTRHFCIDYKCMYVLFQKPKAKAGVLKQNCKRFGESAIVNINVVKDLNVTKKQKKKKLNRKFNHPNSI